MFVQVFEKTNLKSDLFLDISYNIETIIWLQFFFILKDSFNYNFILFLTNYNSFNNKKLRTQSRRNMTFLFYF